MSNIQFSSIQHEDQQIISVLVPGKGMFIAASTHPNFESIRSTCEATLHGTPVADADAFVDLFDVADTVSRKFQQLTERVSVEGGTILFDGDPVEGTLQDQILEFLDNGEDFGPLVNFYEKLTTNPLGDVRAGLFDWIRGQKEEGTLTITPDGDVIGYKSVSSATGADGQPVYRPSRTSISGGDRVNGVEVAAGSYIEQRPGDVVEMPRSKVLHAPSQACGDGLHIGTYSYAKGFQGDTVLLVKFSPRDIVSLPDSNSTWKLRVCRYTVLDVTDGPLDTPLYLTAEYLRERAEGISDALDQIDTLDVDLTLPTDGPLVAGDRVVDNDGDEGTVVVDEDGDFSLEYDDESYGRVELDSDDVANPGSKGTWATRIHGKGGPTSQAAKGNGKNPAQDEKGRFSNGRPNSQRGSNGRFTG